MSTYPLFPVAGTFPAFLNPFDPTFHTAAIAVLYGTVTTPVVGLGGGAVVVGGGGFTSTVLNPQLQLFGWSFERIVPPGFSGTSPIVAWPQRIGPRFAYFATDPGGLPFLT